MKTVEVEILGRRYYLKCDRPEQIQQRAEELNNELKELNAKFNTVDQLKLFVLYTLSLLEKYENEQAANCKLSEEFKQLNKLLGHIESEL
ncbi:MAG: cell division protein ZapA [Candidatus Cloacimonetes bacterium]|nr:cell division protein ZapA [Candidatus Cloacimonadota bacterium]